MLPLNPRKAEAKYSAVDELATMKLWHQRLGHTCEQYLKTMVDQGFVHDNEASGVDASVTGDATYDILGTEATDGMVDGDDGDYGGSARDIRRDEMDSAYHDDDDVSGDSDTDFDGDAEDQDFVDTRSDVLEFNDAGVDDNPADLFTKALDEKRLARLSNLMGVQKEDVRDGYLERGVLI
ncbi:unnamed protein product [Peronospora farinosa]|uniref:GAG-pre-integrase domain-containing protein n=1 Tax=Peronospora farinosa TaxID=134698 RepID=A0AAV0TPP4_9STRA|nr:unnamed protein product [Peronospora farinosa]